MFTCPHVLCPPYFERPIPLVLLAGEGLNKSIWNNTINFLSNRGFSGIALALPDINNIDKVTDSINHSIQKAKLTNPIIISHSISTFVAQKYMESYSASALVLINPIPPQNHISSISKLYEAKHLIDNKSIQTYYKIDHDDISMSNYPEDMLKQIINNPLASALNVEPNACDMLIITTKGDYDMKIIDDDDMRRMQSYHNLDDENIVNFDISNRLPFITDSNMCNQAIYDFIDKIY